MVAFRICRSRVHALSKPFKTREGARKIPERLREGIGVGVIRTKS